MQLTSRDPPEKIIEEDSKLDQFTDSGSDDQNNFELPVPKINDLLKEIEQGDEVMKKIREKSSGFVTINETEVDKLNRNIRYVII